MSLRKEHCLLFCYLAHRLLSGSLSRIGIKGCNEWAPELWYLYYHVFLGVLRNDSAFYPSYDVLYSYNDKLQRLCHRDEFAIQKLLCGTRSSAFHSFFNPILAIRSAGMQYTGSRSTRPGYPSRDSPEKAVTFARTRSGSIPATPNWVWKTSTMSPGLSAIPPPSGS